MSAPATSVPEHVESTPSGYRATLRIAPGRGLVGRHARRIVFVPDGDHDLLDRLLGPPPTEIADVVADIVNRADGSGPEFAVIAWPEGPDTGTMQVLTHGAVRLTSTLPPVPAGADAAQADTQVTRLADRATLAVGPAVRPDTDLVDGVVPADGFELQLVADTAISVPADRDTRNGASGRLSALRAATGPPPRQHVGDVATHHDHPADLADGSPHGSPLERPVTPTYRLRLPGGDHFDLDRSVVVGRQPAVSDAGMTSIDTAVGLLALSAPSSVSRTHALVRVAADGIAVVDCGSAGGTAVVGTSGPLVPTEPWVPTELTAGDTIYLGGPTALVVEEITS